MEELKRLANRKDIRTADRAEIRNLVRKIQQGQQLSYQDRQNMWAYITRYRTRPGEAGR